MNEVHERLDWLVFSRVWDAAQSKASADVRVKVRFHTWDSVEEITESFLDTVTDAMDEKRAV